MVVTYDPSISTGGGGLGGVDWPPPHKNTAARRPLKVVLMYCKLEKSNWLQQ